MMSFTKKFKKINKSRAFIYAGTAAVFVLSSLNLWNVPLQDNRLHTQELNETKAGVIDRFNTQEHPKNVTLQEAKAGLIDRRRNQEYPGNISSRETEADLIVQFNTQEHPKNVSLQETKSGLIDLLYTQEDPGNISLRDTKAGLIDRFNTKEHSKNVSLQETKASLIDHRHNQEYPGYISSRETKADLIVHFNTQEHPKNVSLQETKAGLIDHFNTQEHSKNVSLQETKASLIHHLHTQKYPDNVAENHTCTCVNCKTDSICGGLWKGDVLEKNHMRNNFTVSLVISHCKEDMKWIEDFIAGIDIKDITVISKCNFTEGNLSKIANVTFLPNIGRCDHSYAYWMARMPRPTSEDHIVVFLKASRYLHQNVAYRSMNEMLQIASKTGFGCGVVINDPYSFYHNTEALRTFQITAHRNSPTNFKSNYTNMGHWLDELNIKLPEPLTPVCYTGNFAVKAVQIFDKQHIWKTIENNLMRGDSIEEGHFAERTWAGVLQNPLSANQVKALSNYAHGQYPQSWCCYNGALCHAKVCRQPRF